MDTYTKNLHESVMIKYLYFKIFAKMGLSKRQEENLP